MNTFYVRTALRDATLCLLLSLIVSLTGCNRTITDGSIVNIQPQRVAEWVREDASGRLYMDVRDPEEFQSGHIPGARNIRLPEVSATERDPALNTFNTIVVYGDGAYSARAIAMTKRLLGLGYKDVFLLDGGFGGWRAQGGAVERGTSSR